MSSTLYGSKTLAASAVNSPFRMWLPNDMMKLSWTHSGLTADFIAGTFAAGHGNTSAMRKRLRNDIGFLANELIENAVKFGSEGPVGIEAALDGTRFRLSVTNTTTPSVVPRFKELLNTISSRLPEELLLEQLEATASDARGSASGLGILTLLSDYGAEMAWTISEGPDDELAEIVTHAQINFSNNEDVRDD